MKIKILQFLQEENGQLSSTRLTTLLVILSMIVEWQHCVWTHLQWNPSMTEVGLVTAVLGAKTVAKSFESKLLTTDDIGSVNTGSKIISDVKTENVTSQIPQSNG